MIVFDANIRTAHAHSDDSITTSSVGIPVTLKLASDFDGLAKTVVFKAGNTSVDIALVGDATETEVPVDVLTTSGKYLEMGIYAADGNGTVVIPTVWATVDIILHGTVPSGVDPSDPTPNWVAQVQNMASQAVEDSAAAVETANEAKTAAITAQDSAQASANAAYQSEQNAAQSASNAHTSEVNAGDSATAAAGSANEAEGYAEQAAQSAAQAGYMYFYIDDDGHLIYQHTPNVQVDFYLLNGHLYVGDKT